MPFYTTVSGNQAQKYGPQTTNTPSNNRVFIERKAYEVIFIDDVAVVEMHGVPHKVEFSGGERTIVIDGGAREGGKTITLRFGETRNIMLDGQFHRIRFGAPSRELYLGNQHFRALFGGSPIRVMVGIAPHTFQLLGPVPDVVVHKNPSHELMARLSKCRPPPQMNSNSAPQMAAQRVQHLRQQQLPVPPTKRSRPDLEGPIDVLSLLRKIKQTGILNQLPVEPLQTKPARGETIAAHRPPLPHIPSILLQIGPTMRAERPGSSLENFLVPALQIRYNSVIEPLHKPRVACPQCGIKLKGLYDNAHLRHMAWHRDQAAQQASDRVYTRCSPWFMLDEWFTYSEFELIYKQVPCEQKSKDEEKFRDEDDDDDEDG